MNLELLCWHIFSVNVKEMSLELNATESPNLARLTSEDLLSKCTNTQNLAINQTLSCRQQIYVFCNSSVFHLRDTLAIARCTRKVHENPETAPKYSTHMNFFQIYICSDQTFFLAFLQSGWIYSKFHITQGSEITTQIKPNPNCFWCSMHDWDVAYGKKGSTMHAICK